ncbi:hypothetical protein Golomagni_03854 [Golovinomyces magnicellulatus]|nr:hypothetical protein Golomagni_03854 [Golovinomyces magnicellulatus]
MRLHIFTLLLPLAVFGYDQEPITSTKTTTSTVTQTVTVHITPSASPPLRFNGTMPNDRVHVTASASMPAPSQIYVNKNNTNNTNSTNNTNMVDSPIPVPKESTPIIRGNAAKYLISKKSLLAAAGIITMVTTW